MDNITLEPFMVIGISVRTSNENSQAATDMPAIWGKFFEESIMAKIPNRIEDSVYCIYTDYEKDHTRPYTAILGCKVSSLESIPEGMVGKKIESKTYKKFTAKGNLEDNIVYEEWLKIWNSDLPRRYTADFEVYGEKSQNQEAAEIDIFIAVK
ncbi:GyrI-like domain-containing protein [Belliella sp. DSM 107340]|uniref:GyrI-like domain-containing protein n=1 Tax=Belliella calami TaxID=2923436 RepID=A0ABS9UT25_9BACT|nr:GyrI-like domain-containing protein [Belliella calami]MCH7399398.1 GyrI-like domain-containing protein [Belliella calami]